MKRPTRVGPANDDDAHHPIGPFNCQVGPPYLWAPPRRRTNWGPLICMPAPLARAHCPRPPRLIHNSSHEPAAKQTPPESFGGASGRPPSSTRSLDLIDFRFIGRGRPRLRTGRPARCARDRLEGGQLQLIGAEVDWHFYVKPGGFGFNLTVRAQCRGAHTLGAAAPLGPAFFGRLGRAPSQRRGNSIWAARCQAGRNIVTLASQRERETR